MWGWIAIVAVPLAFWTLIVIVMVMVFGRGDMSEQVDAVDVVDASEVDEPIAAPVRESALTPSGLGWRPPVPSHH
jgi:hypothetical protein